MAVRMVAAKMGGDRRTRTMNRLVRGGSIPFGTRAGSATNKAINMGRAINATRASELARLYRRLPRGAHGAYADHAAAAKTKATPIIGAVAVEMT